MYNLNDVICYLRWTLPVHAKNLLWGLYEFASTVLWGTYEAGRTFGAQLYKLCMQAFGLLGLVLVSMMTLKKSTSSNYFSGTHMLLAAVLMAASYVGRPVHAAIIRRHAAQAQYAQKRVPTSLVTHHRFGNNFAGQLTRDFPDVARQHGITHIYKLADRRRHHRWP